MLKTVPITDIITTVVKYLYLPNISLFDYLRLVNKSQLFTAEGLLGAACHFCTFYVIDGIIAVVDTYKVNSHNMLV